MEKGTNKRRRRSHCLLSVCGPGFDSLDLGSLSVGTVLSKTQSDIICIKK